MIRFLVNLAVYMAAAAIGLFVADMVVSGLSITYPIGFLTAVVIFGLIQAIVSPLLGRLTERRAEMLTGGVGLLSALVALLITSLMSDGLTLDGVGAWISASLIIWLASMLAGFILTLTVAKRVVQRVRD